MLSQVMEIVINNVVVVKIPTTAWIQFYTLIKRITNYIELKKEWMFMRARNVTRRNKIAKN